MKLPRHLGTIVLGTVVVVACSSTPQAPSPVADEHVASSQAAATTSSAIAGLYPTGVSDLGVVLLGGVVDPHYALIQSGDSAFPAGANKVFVVDNLLYPLDGTWAVDTTASEWVSVQAGNSADAQPTTFTYELTFTLSGVDPTTASITGNWACDNSCLIQLNGKTIGLTSPSFTTMVPFTIPVGSAFQTGTNKLDFIVTNAPSGANPTGLRVDALAGTVGCGQDGQCPTGDWCNNVSVSPGVCQAQTPNGTAVPGGNCNATGGTAPGTAGSRGCKSGGCDTSDNICGLVNGDGPCTSGTVCRSTVCDTAAGGGTGRCEQCTASNTTNCTLLLPICDTSTETCAACNGDNGAAATADCPAIAPYCPGGGLACGTCGVAGLTVACTATGATHAGTVCEASGSCGSACVMDSNCTATQWCDGGSCAAQLINGTPIPSVAGHSPTLDGTCTTDVGKAVCQSGVCDTKNNACGYADGDGPCTTTAPNLCQSGACSANGNCRAAGGCNIDSDCATTQYCDTLTSACIAKGATGTAIPGGGTCPAGTTDRCLSGVCGADDICGDPNGVGPCTSTDAAGAGGVCRSGLCDTSANGGNGLCAQCTEKNTTNCTLLTPICDGATETCVACNGDNGTTASAPCSSALPYCPGGGLACGTCGIAGNTVACTAAGATHAGGVCEASGACGSACVVDGDCAVATQWCDTGAASPDCVARLTNGTAIPTVASHDPALSGTCTAAVGTAICQSGVCDTSNNECGYADGHGPCTIANPSACQSGTCSSNGTCRAATGCNVDKDCATQQYCDTSSHLCEAQGATGAPIPGSGTCVLGLTDRCLSGVCGADNVCGLPNGAGPCSTNDASGASGICRSNVCDPAGNLGLGLCEQCTAFNATNCSGPAPICDALTEACVACNGDNGTIGTADCPVSAPYCPGGGAACTTCGTAGGTTTCTATGAVHAGGVCETTGACGTSCVGDVDCTKTQWCDTGDAPATCVAQLLNGTPIPTVSGHAPTLDGTCTVDVGKAVCLSQVCDTKNNACGYASGDGPCTVADPSVCQSGACSTSGTCRPAAGCNTDNDCNTATQYCDTATNECLAKGATGLPIPGGGTCPATGTGAGTSDRCLAGVCGANEVCGDQNGFGTCTVLNASGPSGICQSGTCDAKDSKCGLANGDGICTLLDGQQICRSMICSLLGPNIGDCVQCTSSSQCASTSATPVCNLTTNTCVAGTNGGGGDGGTDAGTGDGGGIIIIGGDSGSGSDDGGLPGEDGAASDDGGNTGTPDATTGPDASGGTDASPGDDGSVGNDSGQGEDASGGNDAGGSGDGGGIADSGPADSGSDGGGQADAGQSDAGDGGVVADAGKDAGSGNDSGTDSGTGKDSGTGSDAGENEDAGSPGKDASAASDSGTPDGSVYDSGPGSPSYPEDDGTIEGGGCSCRTTGARETGSDGALFAVAAIGILAQRRRKRRGARDGQGAVNRDAKDRS